MVRTVKCSDFFKTLMSSSIRLLNFGSKTYGVIRNILILRNLAGPNIKICVFKKISASGSKGTLTKLCNHIFYIGGESFISGFSGVIFFSSAAGSRVLNCCPPFCLASFLSLASSVKERSTDAILFASEDILTSMSASFHCASI